MNRKRYVKLSEDQDTAMFFVDTTLSKVINITQHSSGTPIGNTQKKQQNLAQFFCEFLEKYAVPRNENTTITCTNFTLLKYSKIILGKGIL
jgi:hypothetical protein